MKNNDFFRYDYYYWKKFFTRKDIQKLYKVLKKHENKGFNDHPAYTATNKDLKNLKNVSAVQWIHLKEFLGKLNDTIALTNRQEYGFNIDYPIFDFENVLFNTYLKDNFYDWHKDGSNHALHDIKFTVLINTSLKKYSGGDFQIFTTGGAHTIPTFNDTGDVIMFKSDTPHRVLPVQQGERNSITLFIKGSKFV